jgi:hypothetical protein
MGGMDTFSFMNPQNENSMDVSSMISVHYGETTYERAPQSHHLVFSPSQTCTTIENECMLAGYTHVHWEKVSHQFHSKNKD